MKGVVEFFNFSKEVEIHEDIVRRGLLDVPVETHSYFPYEPLCKTFRFELYQFRDGIPVFRLMSEQEKRMVSAL